MSWERSRYIPWSRIDAVSSSDDGLESQKERLFRTLNKEAHREKEMMEQSKSQLISDSDSGSGMNSGASPSFVPPEIVAQQSQKKKGLFNSGVDYTTPDLFRTLAFGMNYSILT